MTTVDNTPESTNDASQLVSMLASIPLLGLLLRDADSDKVEAWAAVLGIIVAWVGATAIFGYAGLILFALAMVAGSFACLVIISRG